MTVLFSIRRPGRGPNGAFRCYVNASPCGSIRCDGTFSLVVLGLRSGIELVFDRFEQELQARVSKGG